MSLMDHGKCHDCRGAIAASEGQVFCGPCLRRKATCFACGVDELDSSAHYGWTGESDGSHASVTLCRPCWTVKMKQRLANETEPKGDMLTVKTNQVEHVTYPMACGPAGNPWLQGVQLPHREPDPAEVILKLLMTNHHITTVDPLDVEYDGVSLRTLRQIDCERRHEDVHASEVFASGRHIFTPDQRTAIYAHWSAELRAKVAASTAAAEKRERCVVTIDMEDE